VPLLDSSFIKAVVRSPLERGGKANVRYPVEWGGNRKRERLLAKWHVAAKQRGGGQWRSAWGNCARRSTMQLCAWACVFHHVSLSTTNLTPEVIVLADYLVICTKRRRYLRLTPAGPMLCARWAAMMSAMSTKRRGRWATSSKTHLRTSRCVAVMSTTGSIFTGHCVTEVK